MSTAFPDTGPQEETIRTIGNAELLFKRGVKILRFNKARWGSDDDGFKYGYLAPYLYGRVLHLGVGLGLSLDAILDSGDVTEILAYEWEQDIADIYTEEHSSDPRLTIEVADAHTNKPSGTFDLCLYELMTNNEIEYLKTKEYLQWIWQRMNSGGYLILPADRFSRALMGEFPQLSWSEVGVKDAARPTIRPLPIWIVVQK